MSEKKYSKRLDAVVIKTTSGLDWVGYKTEDEIHHGTMTKNTWDNLEEVGAESSSKQEL